MANTLNVPSSHDYRGEAIGTVEFLNFTGTAITASFNPSQLSAGLQVDGNGNEPNFQIFMNSSGAFSAASWSFVNWFGYVVIYGRADATTITGSPVRDFIYPRGADAVIGGSGDNNFFYETPADITAGQTIAGGPDGDLITIAGGGNFDFRQAHLSSIDFLAIDSHVASQAHVYLTGQQIGAGHITAVDAGNSGSGHPVTLVVSGAAVNLSTLLFDHWLANLDFVVIRGTAGHDALIGSNRNDRISAATGSDGLRGGAGNDVLAGGPGDDHLRGGSGADRFAFTATLNPAGNLDHIADFSHAAGDRIALKHAVFAALPLGTLSAAAFHNSAHAGDASDRLIYDRAHGLLFYDPDGTGSRAQTLFAVLDNHAALTAADFVVVA